MRLKSIKLAGFKSFVDPTTVHFPSNLCGIVGPNGCGKSNIIDAVRWVMGESSAKNLRGESMADVIFNGSSARKPVAQATIELVFDNNNTMLTGEMAKYNEISIRRKLIRDGTSHYYLNGTKCRRRDITDIFLGTGLGPRSYAIIEQGMISRLIDAKPEELRVYVEEAAGISKYKERRRETENRMRRTQENLERLTDIRDELGRQLQTLKRQSESAVKYKQFKQEERQAKAELQAMQWRALDSEVNAKESVINERQNGLEACIAKQHATDTNIEKSRVQQTEHSELFSTVQGHFYSVGADIARLEQTLQHQQERRQQLSADLQQAEGSAREIDSHLGDDQSKLQAWETELATAEPNTAKLQQAEQQTAGALQAAESEMQDWQAQWDEFNSGAAQASQAAKVQQSRIAHIEQSQETLQQRIARLEQEKVQLADGPQESDLSALGNQLAALELQSQQLESSKQELSGQLEQQRSEQQRSRDGLDKVRSELQSKRGRYASLEALQQAALGQNDKATQRWLQGHGLEKATRLGEQLQVDAGWEVAVETVLGNYLQAVHVDDLDGLAPELAALDAGTVTLITGADVAGSAAQPATSLLSRVSAPLDLRGMLHGIKVADDLNAALGMRAGLQADESVITPEGIWLGANWLRVARDNDAQAGILQRQTELQELTEQISSREAAESELQQQLQQAREAVTQLEKKLNSQQSELAAGAKQQGVISAQISAKRVRLEEFALRKDRATRELSENHEQFQQESDKLTEARDSLQLALEEMEANDAQRSMLLQRRDAARTQLNAAREQARTQKDAHHQHVMRCQSLRTQAEAMRQALQRMHAQAAQLRDRKQTLSQALSETEAPIQDANAELEVQLAARLEVESELEAARRQLEVIDSELRDFEKRRTEGEREAEQIRDGLQQLRLDGQTLRVKRQGLEEQLQAGQFAVQQVLRELVEAASIDEWEQRLQKLANRIQRLGAINLAAIEEYDVQAERKTYLDAQNDELVEALETLENAIRKIDKETRSRFKETFDSMNQGLGELFPRVFGGGNAYLEMTGDDLLDTGVTIMARPPGKRNSTIHLLSGGEKALTAIALVFAIFRLNPAPFCMLDEVDAPLDDANVGRYANMVKEMSKHIQFIYITHNKISMEVAHQLMGVTMIEAGASRLVSVDVDEAVQLAAV